MSTEKKKIFYRVLDHCEETFFEFCSDWSIGESGEFCAQGAAHDYFTNHDGWEARWPLTFALHESREGKETGRYLVELEAEPSFWAKKLKEGR